MVQLMVESRLAGYERVIRDDCGRWIKGFSKRIGITSSFVADLWGLREGHKAELWGLLEGLMLCCTLNISSLVELDAKAIMDVLSNSSYANNIISPILDDCKLLVSSIQQIRIKHCFCQANCCADSLAKMNFNQVVDFSTFDSPPMDMIDVFEDNLNGMYFNRICLEPLGFL